MTAVVPLKVLLIEDSEADAELVTRELVKSGFALGLRRAGELSSLMNALEEPGWQLVLSDYRLPDFTGLDALALVRAKLHDVPFILVSGAIGEELAVSAVRLGAQDYVLAGNLARLGAVVHRELAEAENRRQRHLAETALKLEQDRLREYFDATSTAQLEVDLRDALGSLALPTDQKEARAGRR